MKKIFNIVSNKFFLASVAFLAWMLFFDSNDFISQYEYRKQVAKLRSEKEKKGAVMKERTCLVSHA